jgi:hypothetical protein
LNEQDFLKYHENISKLAKENSQVIDSNRQKVKNHSGPKKLIAMNKSFVPKTQQIAKRSLLSARLSAIHSRPPNSILLPHIYSTLQPQFLFSPFEPRSFTIKAVLDGGDPPANTAKASFQTTWYQIFTPQFDSRYWITSNILLKGKLDGQAEVPSVESSVLLYVIFDVETLGSDPTSYFPENYTPRYILNTSLQVYGGYPAYGGGSPDEPIMQWDYDRIQSPFYTLPLEKSKDYAIKTTLIAYVDVDMSSGLGVWPVDDNGKPLENSVELNFGNQDIGPELDGNFVDCFSYVGPLQDPTQTATLPIP